MSLRLQRADLASSFNARDGGTKEGRNGLPDWKDKGYVSIDYTRSVSKTVEYAQNDFGLYVVAKGLGKNEEAEKYLARSKSVFLSALHPRPLELINRATSQQLGQPVVRQRDDDAPSSRQRDLQRLSRSQVPERQLVPRLRPGQLWRLLVGRADLRR